MFDHSGDSFTEYTWGQRTCRAFAGTHSAWAVGGGDDGEGLVCGSNYPHNAESAMIYGPFSLADASDAQVTMQAWINSEADDVLFRGVLTDGVHFHGYSTHGQVRDWRELNIDLTDVPTLGYLPGQPQVWLALVFSSNGDTNDAEGAFVDDVRIDKYVGAPPRSLAPTGASRSARRSADTVASWSVIR